jgi:hypothetical protein
VSMEIRVLVGVSSVCAETVLEGIPISSAIAPKPHFLSYRRDKRLMGVSMMVASAQQFML